MSDQAHDDKHHEALRLFGSRVKRFRNEQGLTQERFAEMIGKTVEHVSYLERGERYPSFEVIVDIAEALSVSPAHLLSAADSEGDRALAEALPIAPSARLPDPVQETVPVIEKRRNDLERLQAAFRGLREMQRLADDYGVNDILQDNGGKVLQVLILLGLQISPGREGNDAVDDEGNEYEPECRPVREPLPGRLGVLGHLHHGHDLCECCVRADLLGADTQRPSRVDSCTDHRGPGLLGHRQALARDHRLVDFGDPVLDRPVHGDLRPRPHEQ